MRRMSSRATLPGPTLAQRGALDVPLHPLGLPHLLPRLLHILRLLLGGHRGRRRRRRWRGNDSFAEVGVEEVVEEEEEVEVATAWRKVG